MCADIRFALIHSPKGEKVRAFLSLEQLCRTIHTLRRATAIQLQDDDLLFQGELEKRSVVSVFTLDEYGMRQGFLGHAYLDGRSRPAFEAALRASEAEAIALRAAA